MDQAFALVQEFGFAGLRMRLLADKVGVSEGALYRHFPSKEAILLALVDRIEGRLLGRIRAIASDTNLTPRERIEHILRHHVRTLIETRSLPLLLVSEASFSEHETLRRRMGRVVSSYLTILGRLAGEIQGRGTLEPRETALLLMGLPAAVALSHPLLADEELVSRLVESVVPEYVRLLFPQ